MNRKFMSVKHCILEQIRTLPPNTKLPSERGLIEQFGFSRPTIQKALTELESEGIIYRVPRQGSFVADRRLHKSLSELRSFGEDVQATGDSPTTRLLSFEIVPAEADVAAKLGIKEGEPVYFIARLRCKNGEPIIHDHSYFAPFAVEHITCEQLVDSIYRFIEKNGLKVSMAEEILDAVLPPPEIAALLGLRPDEPVIRIDMVAYLSDGRAFEYTISHKNPKKYLLAFKAYR